MDYKKWVDENKLVYLVSGSRLYGTNNEDSDYDYRGVCYMPKTALLGLENFEQYQTSDPDVTVYGLTKFFRLAIQNNPNIMDILFAEQDKWISYHTDWLYIYSYRHLFLSQLVRKTFVGYAISQMKRMKTHREWLLNPPMEPNLNDYGCWLENTKKGGQVVVRKYDTGYYLNGDYQPAYNDYKNDKLQWDNYNEWLKTRNPKRLITEQKVGYDTKNAGHLIRLLRCGLNILKTGDYNPTLTGLDLDVTKQVMNGLFSYDNLLILADDYISIIDSVESDLQKVPDYNGIQDLLIKLNLRKLIYDL